MDLVDADMIDGVRRVIRGNFGVYKKFFCKMILFFENCLYLCSPKTESNSPVAVFETSSGCSSARLEYTSGGRGVASSNLVTPTTKKH